MKKRLYIALGFVCLAVGAVGVFIPGFPGPPLIILAGFLFAQSSPRMLAIVQRVPVLGPFIDHFATGRVLTKGDKTLAIGFLWLGLTISVLLTQKLWLTIMLAVVGVAVTVHIVLLKPREPRVKS
jgi:uncharacterized membrane protein YbaN (DUF454 family)